MVVSVALVAVAAALIIGKCVIIRDNAEKRFQSYLKKTKRFYESSKCPVTKIRRIVKRNLRP